MERLRYEDLEIFLAEANEQRARDIYWARRGDEEDGDDDLSATNDAAEPARYYFDPATIEEGKLGIPPKTQNSLENTFSQWHSERARVRSSRRNQYDPDINFFRRHILPVSWALAGRDIEKVAEVTDAALITLGYLVSHRREADLALFFANAPTVSDDEYDEEEMGIEKGKFQDIYSKAGKAGCVAYGASFDYLRKRTGTGNDGHSYSDKFFKAKFRQDYEVALEASIPRQYKEQLFEAFTALTEGGDYPDVFLEKGIRIIRYFMGNGKEHLLPDYFEVMKWARGMVYRDHTSFSMMLFVADHACEEIEALNNLRPKTKAQLLRLMEIGNISGADGFEYFTFQPKPGKRKHAEHEYDQITYVHEYITRLADAGHNEAEIDEIFELSSQYPWLTMHFFNFIQNYARIDKIYPGKIPQFLETIDTIHKSVHPKIGPRIVDHIFEFWNDPHIAAFIAGIGRVGNIISNFRKSRDVQSNDDDEDFQWDGEIMRNFREAVEIIGYSGLKDPAEFDYEAAVDESCAFLNENRTKALDDTMILHILYRRSEVYRLLTQAGILEHVARHIDFDDSSGEFRAIEHGVDENKIAIAKIMVMIHQLIEKIYEKYTDTSNKVRGRENDINIVPQKGKDMDIADYEKMLLGFDENDVNATTGEGVIEKIRSQHQTALRYVNFAENTEAVFQVLGIAGKNRGKGVEGMREIAIPEFFGRTNPDTKTVIAVTAMRGDIPLRGIPEIGNGRPALMKNGGIFDAIEHQLQVGNGENRELFERRLAVICEAIMADRKKCVGLAPVGGKLHGLHGFEKEHGAVLSRVLGIQHDSFHMASSKDSLVLPAFATSLELTLMGRILEPFMAEKEDINLQLTGSGRWSNEIAGIVAVSMLLGTSRSVWYAPGAFATSHDSSTGARIMLYDDNGQKTSFPYDLPHAKGRTDTLGRKTLRDIQLFQILSTLARDHEYKGRFKDIMLWYKKKFLTMLERHRLEGALLETEWIYNKEKSGDFNAETKKHESAIHRFNDAWAQASRKTDFGIIGEVQSLIGDAWREIQFRQPAIIAEDPATYEEMLHF